MFISIDDRSQLELELLRLLNENPYIRSLIISINNEKITDLSHANFDENLLEQELYVFNQDNFETHKKIEFHEQILNLLEYKLNDEFAFTDIIGPLTFKKLEEPNSFVFFIDLKYNKLNKTIDIICTVKNILHEDLLSLVYYCTEHTKSILKINNVLHIRNKFVCLNVMAK